MHQGGAEAEVLREAVVEVEADEGLALLAEGVTALEAHLDGRLGIDELAVEDLHAPCGVVDGVVRTLGEERASSCHTHRAWGDVHRAEGDLPRRGGTVFAPQIVLVLLRALGGLDGGHRVELGEGIAVTPAPCAESCGECRAEGLCRGEEDQPFARAYGIALHEVEVPVTACLLLGVKAVQSEDAEELLALQWTIRQVGQGAPCGIIAVDDVELEARTLQSGDTCSKAVGIAHHQRPRRSLRREVRALEELDEE